MKKSKLFLILIVIFVCVVIIKTNRVQAFLVTTNDKMDTSQLEELLNTRIGLMNDYLFEDMTFSELQSGLKDIEEGALLQEDLMALKSIKDNPQDLAFVNHVTIKEVYDRRGKDRQVIVEAVLIWDVSDYLDRSYEEILYTIEMIERNDKIYLTAFDPY